MRKARVFVWLKKDVLDPQGRTINEALHGLGYGLVEEVRQGKAFDIQLNDDGVSDENLRELLAEMSKRILSNPVIEDFTVELLDRS
ncbi:MAG: phosphoribosylformylglycinamidine synthase subunit PurS [Candidatus Coatesbacteria bacterium]|nr:phosphoribosylformylglycinamidine synthase subunit PurS [Candidatus Coatesbacteria bacterium]